MMTKDEIVSCNRVIAGYMGWEYAGMTRPFIFFKKRVKFKHKNIKNFYVLDGWFKYHQDFDSLMGVVVALEKENFGFKICRRVVEVYLDDTKEVIARFKEETKLESIYKAVVHLLRVKHKYAPKNQ